MKVWIDNDGKVRMEFGVRQEIAQREVALTADEAEKLAADIYTALLMVELKKEGALG